MIEIQSVRHSILKLSKKIIFRKFVKLFYFVIWRANIFVFCNCKILKKYYERMSLIHSLLTAQNNIISFLFVVDLGFDQCKYFSILRILINFDGSESRVIDLFFKIILQINVRLFIIIFDWESWFLRCYETLIFHCWII